MTHKPPRSVTAAALYAEGWTPQEVNALVQSGLVGASVTYSDPDVPGGGTRHLWGMPPPEQWPALKAAALSAQHLLEGTPRWLQRARTVWSADDGFTSPNLFWGDGPKSVGDAWAHLYGETLPTHDKALASWSGLDGTHAEFFTRRRIIEWDARNVRILSTDTEATS